MKRAATDHPKMAELADAIAAEYKHHSKFAMLIAVGVLEKLWHFTAKFAPRGDIGRRTNQQIGRWVDWPKGDEDNLIRLLLATNWLQSDPNCRLIVHDWAEHADDSVKKLLKRQGLSFACLDMSPQPEPEARSQSLSISHCAVAGAVSVDDPPFDTVGGEGAVEEWSLLPEAVAVPEPERRQSARVTAEVEIAAKALKSRHPAKRTCGLAEITRKLEKCITHKQSLATFAGSKAEKQIALLRRIDANHSAWCATDQWARDEGEYAKGLANWLAHTEMRYLDSPPTETSTWTEPPDAMILR